MKPSEASTDSAAKVKIDSLDEPHAPVQLTIFSLPKPFSDEATTRAQLNALRSWRALGPGVEVLLLGDEAGIEQTATEEGVRHLGEVARNAQGTPRIDSAFDLARRAAAGEFLLYCNADVILRGEIVELAMSLARVWPEGFLGFGRRRDVKLDRLVDWSSKERIDSQLDQLWREGRFAARVCKEYFLFRRGQFQQLPHFAVGRGNWDNWMVANSRRTGLPVVDLTAAVQALHQEHGYAHLPKGERGRPSRWECYVSGLEARENERLAGGKWLLRGCCADWRIDKGGELKRKRWSRLNLDFWSDLPRFLRLSCRLPFQR